jgi:hypothetical protein
LYRQCAEVRIVEIEIVQRMKQLTAIAANQDVLHDGKGAPRFEVREIERHLLFNHCHDGPGRGLEVLACLMA